MGRPLHDYAFDLLPIPFHPLIFDSSKKGHTILVFQYYGDHNLVQEAKLRDNFK